MINAKRIGLRKNARLRTVETELLVANGYRLKMPMIAVNYGRRWNRHNNLNLGAVHRIQQRHTIDVLQQRLKRDVPE
jgi:hypothetical protein